ncbi:unnamed protein product [Closterium sp. NIES-65]|nr:unnamed protein product [Closterium sp. NIES-65]
MSNTLEVTVVGGVGLSDKELFTRQDPYVVLEYGQQRFRSKTDIDGGTNPAFNATFTLSLLPGLNELCIVIWNENVLRDNVIGSCRIALDRVLATGFEDGYFPVYNKRQQQAGSRDDALEASVLTGGAACHSEPLRHLASPLHPLSSGPLSLFRSSNLLSAPCLLLSPPFSPLSADPPLPFRAPVQPAWLPTSRSQVPPSVFPLAIPRINLPPTVRCSTALRCSSCRLPPKLPAPAIPTVILPSTSVIPLRPVSLPSLVPTCTRGGVSLSLSFCLGGVLA